MKHGGPQGNRRPRAAQAKTARSQPEGPEAPVTGRVRTVRAEMKPIKASCIEERASQLNMPPVTEGLPPLVWFPPPRGGQWIACEPGSPTGHIPLMTADL